MDCIHILCLILIAFLFQAFVTRKIRTVGTEGTERNRRRFRSNGGFRYCGAIGARMTEGPVRTRKRMGRRDERAKQSLQTAPWTADAGHRRAGGRRHWQHGLGACFVSSHTVDYWHASPEAVLAPSLLARFPFVLLLLHAPFIVVFVAARRQGRSLILIQS